jgi:hypothetical protein
VNAATAAVELDISVDQGEEGKIASLSDALAGMEHVAHLADEDISGTHGFAAEPLYPAALSVAVASVSAGPLSFLVCHSNHLSAENRLAGVPPPARGC